jgi:hypothetical protein
MINQILAKLAEAPGANGSSENHISQTGGHAR